MTKLFKTRRQHFSAIKMVLNEPEIRFITVTVELSMLRFLIGRTLPMYNELQNKVK